MKEKISVIIPIYNVEEYIKEAINSVINQTYKNIEIIAVIDGSTDNSLNIVKSIKDPRLKIIERENKGVLFSRIEGVLKSSGKYVMFLDGDDYLEENAVETLYKTIMKDSSDIVKANYKKNIDGTIMENKKMINNTFTKEQYEPIVYDLLYNDIYFNSMCYCLVKKDLFLNLKYDYNLKYGEDLNTMLDIILKSKKISIINDFVYYYRINKKGITLTKNKKKIEKKLSDTKIVYDNLYNYVDLFEIENKKYYKSIANTKKIFYIIYNSISVINNLKDLKKLQKNIDNKEINYDFLNNYNFIYKLLIKNFINKRYVLSYILVKILKIKR